MMKMMIIPVFIAIIALIYLIIKSKINEGVLKARLHIEQKKNEVELKKKEDVVDALIKNIDLNLADKQLISKIFKKKVKLFSYVKSIPVYDFFYRQGDVFNHLMNKEYEVIKVSLKKLEISGDIFYSIDVLAWKTKYDFEHKKEPSKEIKNILSTENNFKDQINITFKGFLKPIKIKSYEKVTINNS